MNFHPLGQLRWLIFIGWLLFAARPALSADAAPALTPLGSFMQLKADGGEHAYGHRIVLWRAGGRLVGELTYWEWNVEGQRGDFMDGTYDAKTGSVQFRVTVSRHDTQERERSSASFSGQLKGSVLTGTLKWEGQAAQWRGESGAEQLKLRRDRKTRPLPFGSISAWQAQPLRRYE